MAMGAELGLLSYGRTTGLAVSLGDRLSIIPYVDGFVLEDYSFEADFGGRDVTRAWQQVASERYPLHADHYLAMSSMNRSRFRADRRSNGEMSCF
eukprot:COSAG02_NODE_233_length_27847_cov_20.383055_14_plen_95_part_00